MAASAGRQELDGDQPVEGDLARQEDDPHPAAAELPIERIAPGDLRLQGEELGGERVFRLEHEGRTGRDGQGGFDASMIDHR